MVLSTTVERGLSVLGYPSISHRLINRFVTDHEFEIADSARIASGCLLRGKIDLDERVRLSRGCVLNGEVTVGRGTNFEPQCGLIGTVSIGNYCAVASGTTFQQQGHQMRKPAMQIRLYEEILDSELEARDTEPITVGSDVWTGHRSTILSGVTVGNGAVIGAGAVVTDDVEPYAIVGGVPARRIGWRFPRPVRERLEEIAWWEWDEETIHERREFFEADLTDLDDLPEGESSAIAPAVTQRRE